MKPCLALLLFFSQIFCLAWGRLSVLSSFENNGIVQCAKSLKCKDMLGYARGRSSFRRELATDEKEGDAAENMTLAELWKLQVKPLVRVSKAVDSHLRSHLVKMLDTHPVVKARVYEKSINLDEVATDLISGNNDIVVLDKKDMQILFSTKGFVDRNPNLGSITN
uniref:Uncharacterized protein n=1 Tax=Fibrocapsa japonica TaxID=94617 RepID=A0A7S2Y0N0_9STRA|mmetsp:Transcript_5686/g.8603  ORF Transcript_5686/g.8603 Transcript_5686/m.8603 type:complete len:165 (+) Transcript_5686:92-586(+)